MHSFFIYYNGYFCKCQGGYEKYIKSVAKNDWHMDIA